MKQESIQATDEGEDRSVRSPAIRRIDTLSEPPIVGQRYLVPVVLYRWDGMWSLWPVMGPKHDDAEFLEFKPKHYHLDFRFVSRLQYDHLKAYKKYGDAPYTVAATPLSDHEYLDPMPPPQWNLLECKRLSHRYPFDKSSKSKRFKKLYKSFEGRTAIRGKSGWICPHRHFQLGSIVPVKGVIVCPLHGLRIDAATGKCRGLNEFPSPVIATKSLQGEMSPESHGDRK